jgi:hypothetical protein
MSSRRFVYVSFVVGLLIGSSACGDDETIVSVNVNSTDDVGNPSAIIITISQDGQSPVTKEIMPPTRMVDAGTLIEKSFFERITLPDSWEHEESTVKVEAKNSSGVYLTAETKTTVRPGGATTAFVDLGKKPETMKPSDGEDAGTADAQP